MAKVLSDTALAQYKQEGYYFPLDILSSAEVVECRTRLEEYQCGLGHSIDGADRSKTHLLLPWIDELIRHPRILDSVEDLIGPDILCWNTVWWIKEPKSEAFVSWHQDRKYIGLDSDAFVTAWLALSPSTVESGCVRILPASHKEEILPHRDEYKEHNMLSRGQEIAVPVDESKTVAMELAPGQISLHDVRLAHASDPNRSEDRRIGLSMHFIPPSVRQIAMEWDSATLVRGEDRYHHFALTPRPTRDFDPETVRFHKRATDAFRAIVFNQAERVRPRY